MELYTEILACADLYLIAIKYKLNSSSDLPRHRSKKESLKSCAIQSVFTEQEQDNKERRLVTSRMLCSCSHCNAFVKTNASSFFTWDV